MHPKPLTQKQLDRILSEKFQKRFWPKVNISGLDECWPWKRSLDSGGYGTVGVLGCSKKAHRIAWVSVFRVDMPPTKDALHSCIASRTCCNPIHLRPGDDKDNRRDAMAQGRAVYSHVEGEQHGRHKLAESEVLRIRELRATGLYKQKDLASMFNVCREMISYIVRRKNWTHI
jgi:hypothetical protein